MMIKFQPKILLQMFWEYIINSAVIFESIICADVQKSATIHGLKMSERQYPPIVTGVSRGMLRWLQWNHILPYLPAIL